MAEDTIAAIATPAAAGGIGILRISGRDALKTAEKIFLSKKGKKLDEMAPYTAAYGHAVDGEKTIDECIALVFREPKSYTGEDVVELSCHGGIYVMRRVLKAALRSGARLALPGEFTKRAFLNGRIDLTQAESVMELINAKSELEMQAAVSLQEGSLYGKIKKIRDGLVDLSSDITAWIDFPDEEVPELQNDVLESTLVSVEKELDQYISGYNTGEIIREGVRTSIVGKPNTGKSTIMNLLSGYEKSIVTDIPGTTRDVVEGEVNIGKVVLKLADTAGLRKTKEPIEKIGVEKTIGKIKGSGLILAVFDGSRALDAEDEAVVSMVKEKKTVAVINKTDLPPRAEVQKIERCFQHVIKMSAKNAQGVDRLIEQIENVLGTDRFDCSGGMLANERQLDCVCRAKNAVKLASEALGAGTTLDAVSVLIDEATAPLFELTGENAAENVIDRVFEKFCVGK